MLWNVRLPVGECDVADGVREPASDWLIRLRGVDAVANCSRAPGLSFDPEETERVSWLRFRLQ